MELYAIGGLSGSVMRENGSKDGFARRYGGHLGILFDVGSDNILFETGLMYSSRGTTFVQPLNFGGGGNSYPKLAMNFIDIPALVVIAPSTFRFSLGPQLSFLTKAGYEGKNLSSTELDATFKKTTLGLRYGVGYSGRHLILKLDFINGISDLYKHPDVKWKNNALQLSIGYKLIGENAHQSSSSSSGTKKSKKKKESAVPDRRTFD